MHGAIGGERLGARRGVVRRVGRPRVRAVEPVHRPALALPQVVHVVLAEHLGERVDVVGVGRRRAPGVVAAVAELDVEVHARERGAAGVDARTVQVLLHQDLRHVVADLRAHHGDRVTGRRLARGDELPVGGVRALGGGAHQVRPDAAARRARAGGAGHRRRRRRGLDRAGVGQREPALGERVAGLVVEPLAADRRDRLGVALLAEVLPGQAALLRAEALRERLEDLRGVQLAPAALAEDAADERRRRDDVVERPRVGRLAERRVLGGQLARVELGRVDVGVDALHVGRGVVDDLLAAGAVLLGRVVDLALQVGLGVGRQRPLRAVHLAVGRPSRPRTTTAARGRCGAGCPSGTGDPRRPRSRRRTSCRPASRRRRGARRRPCRARWSRPRAASRSTRSGRRARRTSRP